VSYLLSAVPGWRICTDGGRLLRAAASANNPTQKSLFKAHLIRGIYQLGSSEWKRVKSTHDTAQCYV
jgi:hypothetical protein